MSGRTRAMKSTGAGSEGEPALLRTAPRRRRSRSRYLHPHCIAVTDFVRCRRPARKSSGDIFVCSKHSTLIFMARLDDSIRASTRRMLAHSRWNTLRQGRALIERLRRRREAA